MPTFFDYFYGSKSDIIAARLRREKEKQRKIDTWELMRQQFAAKRAVNA